MEVSNITALVTGGASGLGEATVRALVTAGAQVLIVDRDEGRAKVLASELGPRAQALAADVSSETDVRRAVEQAASMGPLRCVVQCAGVGWASRTLSRDGVPHDLDAFKKVVEINLVGTFNVMRLAAAAIATQPPMSDGARGVIINTASVAAFDGQIGQIAYAASKAAVAGMTLPAARDLSKLGIRVVTIAPGTFDTPMLSMLPEPQRQALAAGIPFPARLGRPADYARLALHIVENDYLNGETIRLDGALRMPPK